MIVTKRFYLDELTPEKVSTRYLSWLKNKETSKFLEYPKQDLSELKEYVAEKYHREDTLLLGIFVSGTNEHIGNIKYEPIVSGYTVLGVLIGEHSWHGKGVAAEAITASAQYLRARYQTEKIYLGVDYKNTPAIRAYKKIGFLECTILPFEADIKETGTAMVYTIPQAGEIMDE